MVKSLRQLAISNIQERVTFQSRELNKLSSQNSGQLKSEKGI
jgi:hypothetical protein